MNIKSILRFFRASTEKLYYPVRYRFFGQAVVRDNEGHPEKVLYKVVYGKPVICDPDGKKQEYIIIQQKVQ